jgi:hypothetical protein
MKEDDVSAILNKTREYFHFIKGRIAKESITVSVDDSVTLKNIELYLIVISEEIGQLNKLKSSEQQNILTRCFNCLQRLDQIAKDYKIFRNGSLQ